jgi:hypothetical protein
MSAKKRLPDPHFGPDDVMLRWAEGNGLTVVRDEEGNYDWHAVYQEWLARGGDDETNEEDDE